MAWVKTPSRGRFITFEGIEGCGKSTCIRHVAGRLRRSGRRVVVTREPGGTPDGLFIRKLLLESSDAMDPRTELVLYCVDRWIHSARVILPRLRRGGIVLSDRYYDSTMAYQGAGRKLPSSFLREWVLGVGNLPRPDLTLLLDCPVETGFRRLRSRGFSRDRMEREALSFHRRVRAAYLERARRDPERFRVIDSSRSLSKVLLDVEGTVENLLPSSRRR
ncbi:MAG: dTMP kinase [Nitrospirae bacterium]|nr:dTMP kinase [Nitrospirota bacterium]